MFPRVVGSANTPCVLPIIKVSDSLKALFFKEFIRSDNFSDRIFMDSRIRRAFAVSTMSELVNP